MPLAKNTFLKGKMNKDLDPRLVSDGEYLDARNISVLNSTTGNSGSVENVLGNIQLSDFGLSDRHLEIIGKCIDEANDRIFVFVTNYSDSSIDKLSNFAPVKSKHYICVYDLRNNISSILVGGNFLNFSKTHEILSVNVLEEFLFFTDNRNQPRKINIKKALVAPFGSDNPYYNREENISVAKYYPWKPIDLYRNSLTGELSVYDSEMVGAITQNITDGSNGILYVSIPDAGGISTSGSGIGAEATIIIEFGVVTSIKVTTSGSGFNIGDTITVLASSLGSTDDLIITVRECDIKKESTLKDTKSELLPYSIDTTVRSSTSNSTTYLINESPVPVDISEMYGCKVIAKSVGGVYKINHEDNITITNISAETVTLSDPVSLNETDIVTIGANPYYIQENKSDDVLTEQFVRFSYRYIYDDNEASLMAPFTQHAFIPKQDGHFLGDDLVEGDSEKKIDRDEQEAIKSTIVNFFENKVTEAGLVISAPEGIDGFKNLSKDLKVKSIEVLYKSSKDQSIKVIDSIGVDEFVGLDENKYEYVYKSEKPIRTLPQKDLTRVYDIVPIRAKAQEVIGNRVIYGNILLKSTSPSELNYSISVADKARQSDNYGTLSKIEYQSSTVKQNRTYQVGIVLVDKFGRQSDVILSKNSSVFNKFKSPNDALVSAEDIYAGDSLKLALNDVIPEVYSKPGYVGLYGESNPIGWYSYKVVVKQQEQSYYNLYVPTLLNGYPHAANDHESHGLHSDLAHITLFGDNINKAPRDLNKISGQDKVFSSSVELVSRVDNSKYTDGAHTSFQNSSNRSYDEITLIGERNEIGLAKTELGVVYNSSPFFGIPKVPENESANINDSRGSNPLIGRMFTNSTLGTAGGHGITTSYTNGDPEEISFERLRLNVLETKPTESALDIFWETTTAGLISELNSNVSNSEPEGAVAVSVQSLGFRLTEASNIGDVISAYFSPLDFNRNPIINDDVEMSITSVTGGGGTGFDFSNDFELVKEDNNRFRLKNNKEWVYVANSNIVHNFKFSFLVTTTIGSNSYNSKISTSEPNVLSNESPKIYYYQDLQTLPDEDDYKNIVYLGDIIHSNYQEGGDDSREEKYYKRYNDFSLPLYGFNGSESSSLDDRKSQVSVFVVGVDFYSGYNNRGWQPFRPPSNSSYNWSLRSLIDVRLTGEAVYRMYISGLVCPISPEKDFVWDKWKYGKLKDIGQSYSNLFPVIESKNLLETTFRVKLRVTDAASQGLSSEYTIQFRMNSKSR